MYKKCMILSCLVLFLTACGSTEVIKYVDKPVLVFPSEALLEPEGVPVIKGDDVKALIDVYVETRSGLYKANEKLKQVGEWKEGLKASSKDK